MKRTWQRLTYAAFALLCSCGDRSLLLDGEVSAEPLEPDPEIIARMRWSCLPQDSPGALPEIDPPPAAIAYVVPIVDAQQPESPVDGLSIQVCQIGDAGCIAPVPVVLSTPNPDLPYVYQINMPYALDAYLRLAAPGRVPTEYYFQGPLVGSPDGSTLVIGETIAMDRVDAFAQTLALLDTTPEEGLLMLRVTDCTARPADGARLKLLSNEGVPWVMRDGTVVRDDDELATDSSGVAGFAALVPGVYAVGGILQSDCVDGQPDCTPRRFGQAIARIRAGTVTITTLSPNAFYGR